MHFKSKQFSVLYLFLIILTAIFAMPDFNIKYINIKINMKDQAEAATTNRVRRATINRQKTNQKRNVTPSIFARGAGTQESPYVITTAAQLSAFSASVGNGNAYLGKYIKLGADIDLKDIMWIPIGVHNNNGGLLRPFKGFFNGAGFTIYNMGSGNSVRPAPSMFGSVDGATISNISLESVVIHGEANVGAIVGFMSGSVLKNCLVSGVITGESAVGGIVGSSFKGIIENCSFSGSVSGLGGVGGLVGTIDQTIIRICKVAGGIGAIGGNVDVGGLVGGLLEGVILDCTVDLVTIHGEKNVGGLVGNIIKDCNIRKSNFNGQSDGDINIGGLVGSMAGGNLLSCAVIGSLRGKASVGGIAGELSGGEIRDCSSGASINGITNIGGLIGLMSGGTLNANVNKGMINGGENVGGIAGYFLGGDLNPQSNRNTGSVRGYFQTGPMVGTGTDVSVIY